MSQEFRTEVIEQLERCKSDLSKPHQFDFYLYLPSESAARQAADKVRESDFTAEIRPGATGNNWLCLASVTIVPQTAALSEIGDFFEQVAAALDGDFDGWEADVKPSAE